MHTSEKFRPWNSAMTVERKGGNTYKENWKSAVDSGARIISITSFNEWHEGTQIEPAVPMTSLVDHYLGGRKPAMFTYKNYVSSPNYYLSLTRLLVDEFQQSRLRWDCFNLFDCFYFLFWNLPSSEFYWCKCIRLIVLFIKKMQRSLSFNICQHSDINQTFFILFIVQINKFKSIKETYFNIYLYIEAILKQNRLVSLPYYSTLMFSLGT